MKIAYNAESAIKQKISLKDKLGSLLYLNNLLSGLKDDTRSVHILTFYAFKLLAFGLFVETAKKVSNLSIACSNKSSLAKYTILK